MKPTYEALMAVLEAALAADDQAEPDDICIDWDQFWTRDLTGPEWLAEPIIPAQRSVAMFARGGAGKSLLALWIATALATGREIFGATRPPIHVLYLDWEMTEADLQQRLDDMGYGPDDDLSHLHYALLPPLPPLDERQGGDEVVWLAAAYDAELVVIDTFGRAVKGDENEADTVRAWYRWTGQRLKGDGRAFLRIDHAGKDPAKGQRGSSAKNDDVDIVWHLTVLEGDVVRLRALKQRMQWVPEVVDLQLSDDDDVTYRILKGMSTYRAGAAEIAETLDGLGLPVDVSRREATAAYRAAGHQARNAMINDAVRMRRERVTVIGDNPVDNPEKESGTTPGRGHLFDGPETVGDHGGTGAVTRGDHVGDHRGPLSDATGPLPASLLKRQGTSVPGTVADPGAFG